MTVLRAELSAEREKEKLLEQRKREHETQQIVEIALQQGAQFASQLLSAVATPEVEKQLVNLLLKQLENLPIEKLEQLRSVNAGDINATIITSAYPLQSTTQQALKHACKESLLVNGEFIYRQDPAIIAGLRINIGAWVLATNLQDELAGFVTINNDI